MAGEVHDMPLTIWKPRQYVEGFEVDSMGFPYNGEVAAAPYDRDTKVREVSRFTGWVQEYFCDVGEFEVTTQQVTPDDVQKGFLVEIDGRHFVIEDYVWKYDENGYSCTISGRDLWKFPESHVSGRWIGESYDFDDDYNPAFTGETLMYAIQGFFIVNRAGWFRDLDRYPNVQAVETDGITTYEGFAAALELANETEDSFRSRNVGAILINDIMTHGAEWRMFANWLGVGLRFDLTFDENLGLYTFAPTIYDGKDNGVTFNSRERGVSGFEYAFASRSTVNASRVFYESKWQLTHLQSLYENEDFSGEVLEVGTDDNLIKATLRHVSDNADSYADRAANYSERLLDLGQPTETANASADGFRQWLKTGSAADYTSDEKGAAFTYDDSGVYKYGVHFALGDQITVIDDYLGLQVKQRLTGVKTLYNAGKAKSREFDFSSQRISQSETLRKKFMQIDKRTFGRAKRG